MDAPPASVYAAVQKGEAEMLKQNPVRSRRRSSGALARARAWTMLACLMGSCGNQPINAQDQVPSPAVSETASSQSVGEPSPRVDFTREIWPILTQHCLACHGSENQESGFRLDSRELALTSGDGHAPNLVPGESAASNLLRFARGEVEDLEMPPEGEPLSAEQLELLGRWIDEGAKWGDVPTTDPTEALQWWSLQPLLAPPVPAQAPGGRNEVDAFIRSQLAAHGLSPSPEADRRTLIRRVSFDLIGLPPTAEEIEAFIADTRDNAYEQLVTRLLASPRYGERWARHWMDAAHFAETHGHDQDRIREHAWPYRDYLITAFNEDKPYARFVQEQVAGDVLFPDDPQATVALGFLAAGPWDESSLRDIREDTLDRQIGRYLDRDDMLTNVMSNFASATVQCARCHNHKFDPIPQADYYALQAVFSGVERANRAFDPDPEMGRQRLALQARKKLLDTDSLARREELLSQQVITEVEAWEEGLKATRAAWTTLSSVSAVSSGGATLTVLADHSLLASGTAAEQDNYTLTFPLPAGKITAIRVETLADDSLPHRGPGRQDNGNLHLSELEAFYGEDSGTRLEFSRAVADFDQIDWGVARAIDGNPQTAWGIYPEVGKSHAASFELKQPLSATTGQTLTVMLKQLHGGRHLIGRVRIAISAAPAALAVIPPEKIEAILDIPRTERTEEQQLELALYQQQAQLSAELAALPPPSYVYAAASEFIPDGGLKPPPGPRPIHVLKRGDIRQPLDEASPGALSCIAALPARFELPDSGDEAERRAALARWLTDRNHPLVWRSIVNRVWHWHFGRGIVATPNDFGRMGAEPSHPELLDWLAVWFRDHGQSLKQLHYLIVTSTTYRQVSAARAEDDPATIQDIDNRLLWRMNRTRLDAESIRDAMLAVAGQLDLRMGGPSDRQFDLQPGSHVTPIIDYGKFDLDGPGANRRSIYRFLFRTLPDPFMESLDCPAGDTITPVRDNSVTVQQALAMWNDALVARRSEQLAARLRTMMPNTTEQVAAAVELTLGRRATTPELNDLVAYAEQHGLENLCRVIFNLNEFVFVN
jgi:mono/diheme cytochrome c family protein